MFQKKADNVQKRLDHLAAREEELTSDLTRVTNRVAKHRMEIEALLGDMGMQGHQAEKQREVEGCRKLLRAALESQADLKVMLEGVQGERKKLEVEMNEALVRDVPQVLEGIAADFNNLLDTAVEAIGVLERIHNDVAALQDQFHAESNRRQNALSKLGRIEGLELTEGLGKLALVPSPHSFVFSGAGGNLQGFVGSLLGYRQKLADYEKFKQANPDFGENVAKVRREQEEEEKNSFFPFKALWNRFVG